MKDRKIKIVIKKLCERSVPNREAYQLHSICGAVTVRGFYSDGRPSLYSYEVGDCISMQHVQELLDNPQNDITVTL